VPQPDREGKRQSRAGRSQPRHPRAPEDPLGALAPGRRGVCPDRRAAPPHRRRDHQARSGGERPGDARAPRLGVSGRSRPLRAASAPATRTGTQMPLLIGIDAGGTFTEMVAFEPETGAIAALKTSSTPDAPGQAILDALAEGLVRGGDVEAFSHGTTVGTNALIE